MRHTEQVCYFFQIFLPSGIRFTGKYNGIEMLTNIVITPDRKSGIEGLCGNFDGKANNEGKMQGTNVSVPINYATQINPALAESWR